MALLKRVNIQHKICLKVPGAVFVCSSVDMALRMLPGGTGLLVVRGFGSFLGRRAWLTSTAAASEGPAGQP